MIRSSIGAILLLLTPTLAAAQQGTVYYDVSYDMARTIPDELRDMPGMEDMIALMEKIQMTPTRMVLQFNEIASLLGLDQSYMDSLMAALDPSGMAQNIVSGGNMGTGQTYVDYEAGTYVMEAPGMLEKFLITDDLDEVSWSISEEERLILGYRTLKATASHDTLTSEVWFAPEIPVASSGLLQVAGPPGLVLAGNTYYGESQQLVSFEAKRVELATSPEFAPVFQKPTGGKVVSREEYEEMARAMMKRLQ